MLNQTLILVVVLGLGGCAPMSPSIRAPIAWDGFGRDPNVPTRLPKQRFAVIRQSDAGLSEQEKVLATLRPHSFAWQLVHDEIEATQEAVLSKKLRICSGCVPAQESVSEILTGTIKAAP